MVGRRGGPPRLRFPAEPGPDVWRQLKDLYEPKGALETTATTGGI